MEQPKICILTETYFPVIGGGETAARLLAQRLAADSYPVIVLTRRSDTSLKPVERYGATTVYRLPPVGRGRLKKWGLILTSFLALVRLRRRYDLVFVSGYRIAGISTVLASRLLRKATVLKADSQGEMSGEYFRAGLARWRMTPKQFPFSLFLRLRNSILRHTDAHVAITAEIANELASCGILPEKIHVIPNGVDTQQFCPVEAHQKRSLRHKLGIPADSTVVIYTGRLVTYKGLPLLLDVWQTLSRHYPDLQLLLVGSGGLDIHNCESELKGFVATHGLHETVRFTGSVHDVHEYLQAADVFVFPTEKDAFGLSLVEAMSCGLGVIATRVGAVPSIVDDGRNGLLIQPGNGEELLAALEKLIRDPGLALEIGAAATRSVRARYSAEAITQSYIDLFTSLLATQPLGGAMQVE